MSREINDLHARVAAMCRSHAAACAAAGIDLLVTQTFRSAAEQDVLFAQGRTTPGNIVTNARGGESWHQWRLAYDVVPLLAGKPVWRTSGRDGVLWAKVGALGEQCGLEWAGRWKGELREMAHFQMTDGLTIADLQAGRQPRIA
jgi:peptidoglycan L-alanyl-D-glutamate endopeptidase CwlK